MAEGDITIELALPAAVTYDGPIAQSGEVTLVRGDDYAAADGRALEWENEEGAWPNLTSATITFASTPIGSTSLSKTGAIVVPTGAGQLVRVELTASDTEDLEPGTYRYDLQAELSSDRKVTLARGRLTIAEDEA